MSDTNKDSSFPKKWLDKLPDGFTDTTAAMKNEELQKIVFDCESNIYVIEKAKEIDVDLNVAKDKVKEMAAPYRESKAAQMAKIQYALWLLTDRGVDLDSQDA
jgi:hypothetical protein